MSEWLWTLFFPAHRLSCASQDKRFIAVHLAFPIQPVRMRSVAMKGKTLLVLRHGKSDWETGEEDFHRPLIDRGRLGSLKMG
ncbi:MAG: hypothetical protein V5B07_06150, partial [Candidatus Accumulibacter sp. UW27]